MLPEKLTMQAFGPYVDKQEIDFDNFSHLFLIRGETGSGKTMILDAMTYALYGKSSGGQREELESMRSRFVKDDTPTIIDFTFALHGKHYRFMRKVEVKEKRNKDKTIKVSVDAGEMLDDQFYPFFENPKLRNIEEKAIELIGLTHEQFIQVMVLPQGKFEKLLTSKSEEKQEILRTLFQMDKWENITIYLSDKANLMKKQMDEKKQRMDALYQGAMVKDQEDVLCQIQEKEAVLQKMEEKSLILEHDLTKLQDILNEQKMLHDLVVEQQTLLKKQGQLHQQKQIIEKIKQRIEEYHQVEMILPYFHSYKKSQMEHLKRQADLQKAQQQWKIMQEKMRHLEDMRKDNEKGMIIYQNLQNEATSLQNCKEAFLELQQLQKQKNLYQNKQKEIKQRMEAHSLQLKAIEEQHETMYQAYLNDTAMQLRETLQDQKPCPVCGSLHHPYEKMMTNQYVDVMALKSLKETLEQEKQKQSELEKQWIKISTDYDHYIHQYAQQKTSYQTKFSAYASLDTIEKLQNEEKNLKQKLLTIYQKQQQQQKEIENILLKHKEAQGKLETAKTEIIRAQDMEKEAHMAYLAHCTEDMKEEVLLHQPDAAQIKKDEKQIEEYQTMMIKTASRMEEVTLQLKNKKIEDLQMLNQDMIRLQQERKAHMQMMADVKSRIELLKDIQKQGASMSEEYEKLQPSYQKLLHFSRAMRGDNSVGIERYVLGIMLSNITANANQLLAGVHHGRYQIYRSEHASGKTRKAGLEFSIYDAYSCSMRNVVSLSGGEKFLVSLALSLALSMSVQARNGGISFDCMFIDEGFGTLDEHSIADALSILEKMSKQKGKIGIISHVEVLKENIPGGIEVEKTRNGSTIIIRKD
ncbi:MULTISPECIES: AAA family ATPase [Bacillota]|uniref:Nuclease SbcCD subunit C n=1 Tax=[Eubacterium] hominis TaxID=2764325 RepID=A0A7G9GL60_9FIRM|nr:MULTISPECIES: SMC family ATPase [Bacillota]QNM11542.1 SMC family ATPase [[Eubacterium] hominis]RGB56239.1 SMC family ATPase [Absiella sp. AM22-9]RGB62002.1 SMC family ATPase [Absiella sp. AM10-20]RGB70176.1 SMC family ATPase [Absiella sp. AM09-45]RGB78890.1 SMC family ATPase [Absiella sp. AM09-50]